MLQMDKKLKSYRYDGWHSRLRQLNQNAFVKQIRVTIYVYIKIIFIYLKKNAYTLKYIILRLFLWSNIYNTNVSQSISNLTFITQIHETSRKS